MQPSRLVANVQNTRRDRTLYNLILNTVPSQFRLRRNQRTTRTLAEKEFDLQYYKLEYYMQKLRDDLQTVTTADFQREKLKLLK